MDFVKLKKNKKNDWIAAVDKLSYETMAANKDLPQNEKPFYLSIKEHVLAGYFNSEIVAKHYFEYDLVPGRWEPCIPYAEIGRAWAL